MPLTVHKTITVVLVLMACALFGYRYHYQQTYNSKMTLENALWTARHQGSPNQFGYLTQHWGLTQVETRIEAEVRKHDLTMAIEFKLFKAEGLYGHLTLQFDAGLANHNNQIAFQVDKSSAKITHYSEGLEIDNFKPIVADMLHDMFSSPREIISINRDQVILDIPHLGLLRVNRSEFPMLIR